MQIWAVLGVSFEEWEYDSEEIKGIMLGGNCLVQEGRSVTDLIEYFFDNFGELGQIESVTLWRFLTWLGLNVPLPCMQNEQIKIFLVVNRLTAYGRIGD